MSSTSDETGAAHGDATPAARAASATAHRSKKRLSALERDERRAAMVFLAPWILGLLLLTLGPMLASLYLSFTNYNLFGAPRWVGLENYETMFFSDRRYWRSVWVTLTYVLVSVPLVLIFALLLAVLLDTGIRFLTLYRALFYLPSLMGASVAVALLWRHMFGDNGLVNRVLSVFGISGPRWLGDPSYVIYPLISLNVWTFGAAMIIFLAALRQIPQDLYEAAEIDGAGPVRRFFSITVPLITPVILFNGILNVISAFQAFTPAYVVSGGTGRPVDASLFYTLYLYLRGFSFFEMGYAAAMAWVLLIVIALVTLLILRSSRHWVFYADSRSEEK